MPVKPVGEIQPLKPLNNSPTNGSYILHPPSKGSVQEAPGSLVGLLCLGGSVSCVSGGLDIRVLLRVAVGALGAVQLCVLTPGIRGASYGVFGGLRGLWSSSGSGG